MEDDEIANDSSDVKMQRAHQLSHCVQHSLSSDLRSMFCFPYYPATQANSGKLQLNKK